MKINLQSWALCSKLTQGNFFSFSFKIETDSMNGDMKMSNKIKKTLQYLFKVSFTLSIDGKQKVNMGLTHFTPCYYPALLSTVS